MTRLPAKTLIFAQTISGGTDGQSTLFQALNQYRSSLDNKHEAANRARVLERHLQKRKFHLKNKKKQMMQHDYFQKMAELDRRILEMNASEEEKAIQRQKENNIRNKNRVQMNQRQAKSQLQQTNSWVYKSTQRKRMEHQRIILMESERDRNEKEIWAMKERIREKRRTNKIADYYLTKIQEVRNQKQREISLLKRQSQKQNEKLNRIISRNTKLRLKNQRSTKGSFLKSAYHVQKETIYENNPQQKEIKNSLN